LAPLCLLLMTWPGTGSADVLETLRYSYYTAQHRPPTTLLSALNAVSPIRQDGQIFHGYTKWVVNWQFRWWEEADGRCRLTENQTHVAVDVTLPRLHTTDAVAKSSFDRYFVALHAHEMEHVKIARNVAGRIDHGIRQLPEMPSCRALESAANRLGKQLLDEAVIEEKRMDKMTDHGSRQGAILPR
jgi:predicted secreted Zn-dependent protease